MHILYRLSHQGSPPANVGDEMQVKSLVRKICWRRKWQPTPVLLLGKSHQQRNLAGYSPWGARVRYDLVTKPPPPPKPHWLLGNVIKTTMRYYYTLTEWLKQKLVTRPNAGEDTEKLDHVILLVIMKKSAATLVQFAAKLLQSCPTLCDPIDGSPPGSPVPGILQARTLEWVAISFSSAWNWKVKVKSLSRVWLSWPHGLQPTRLFCPWDFPGKSTGVGCHCLLHWYSLIVYKQQ